MVIVSTDHPARADIDRSAETETDALRAERSLVTLVLTLVELLRQLVERQALRRVDVGDLSEARIERIGSTLMHLEQRMHELCDQFGIRPEDLNLDLGPLGTLLPETHRPS